MGYLWKLESDDGSTAHFIAWLRQGTPALYDPLGPHANDMMLHASLSNGIGLNRSLDDK